MATALLGVLDAPIGVDDVTGYTVTKVGGSPDWHQSTATVGSPAVCCVCGATLPLILQVYCPLENCPYHRTLYLSGCTNRACWNQSESWSVIRQQTMTAGVPTADTLTKSPPEGAMGNPGGATGEDWGVAADDWGVEASDWNDESESWSDETTRDWQKNLNVPQNSPESFPEPQDLTIEVESNLTPVLTTSANQGETQDPVDQMQRMCIDDVMESDMTEKEQENCLVAEDLPLGSDIMEVLDIKIANTTHNTGLDKKTHTTKDSVTSSMTSGRLLNSFYVNVIDEPADEDDLHHERALLSEYSRREGVNLDSLLDHGDSSGKSKGKGGSSEGYEKAAARHCDQNFYKFNKRVSRLPQQIIRYSYQGSPLLLAASLGPIQPCLHCGSPRQFELQLMPALVSQLLIEGSTDPAVEFGTVLVFTCRGSCWEEGATFRKEYALVQPDPDQDLFRK